MAGGNVVTRALKRIGTGYKSLPGIVVRAIVAMMLGTGDLVSDLYTTVNLFLPESPRPGVRDGRDDLLEHGSAGPGLLSCARHPGVCRWARPPTALWPPLWLRRRYWPPS